MRRLSRVWYYAALCLLLTVHAAKGDTAKASARTISNEQWQQLSDEKDFAYRNEIENLRTKQRQLPIERFFMKIIEFFSSPAGKVIIWSLFFLLMGYAVYRIFISEKTMLWGKRAKKNPGQAENHIDEDILDTDWEKLLQQATKSGEFRNAIRYSYMLLLQLLQTRELIQYRSDKTNYQYLADLTDTPYKQAFRHLSRQYEYAWYGNFPVARTAYEDYMQVFDDLKKQLGK